MKQQHGAKRLAVAAAALLCLAWVGSPAQAGSNEAATGALSFEGPVDMAAGTFSGVFSGQLSGSYQGASGPRYSWAVELVNPGDARFTSVEPGCATGTAKGRFHLRTNGFNQVFGAWTDLTLPTSLSVVKVPRSIVAIDATFDFEWQRAGSAGAMVITDAVVDVQLYTEHWSSWDSPGWVRVVDTSEATAGLATARIESSDPTSCGAGVLKGELAGLALPLD
jgi:hypothetical protein